MEEEPLMMSMDWEAPWGVRSQGWYVGRVPVMPSVARSWVV